jgi:hypothetical protein
MRISFVRAVFVVALLASLLVGVSVSAQGVVVTCDSTTTLLYLLAQRDFGYQPMADMGPYELGQYQGVADGMMSGGMAMEATQEMGMAEATPEMGMAEATLDASMIGDTLLLPGMMEGEDPSCTTLRADVEAFLSSQLMMGMTMGDTMEATQEAGMAGVICDSTTTLLLLVAQRNYGYQSMMDMNTFNFGQFQGMFDSMMSSDMMMEATPEMGMAEATQDASMMEATEEAGMMESTEEAGMAASGTMLMPLTVAGEDPACAQLRTDVEQYLSSQFMVGGMGAMEMSGGMMTQLTADQEVPGPGDEDGSGTASVTINAETNEVCYQIQVQGIQLPASGAHIHVGSVGTAGDVVVPFEAPGADGMAQGCVETVPEIIDGLTNNPDIYYVNVHTEEFPAGAVRGQLGGMMQ